MSSDGSSQPWHDFFELESGEKTAAYEKRSYDYPEIDITKQNVFVKTLTARLAVVVALEAIFVVLVIGFGQILALVLHSSVLEPDFDLFAIHQENSVPSAHQYSIIKFLGIFTLTCRSVSSKLAAISMRRGRHKYLLKWNSFSSSNSWVFV